jgi:hypothetical protein
MGCVCVMIRQVTTLREISQESGERYKRLWRVRFYVSEKKNGKRKEAAERHPQSFRLSPLDSVAPFDSMEWKAAANNYGSIMCNAQQSNGSVAVQQSDSSHPLN